MSASMLNITHLQTWIIPHSHLYEGNFICSEGAHNGGLDECQLYLICKRNKFIFEGRDKKFKLDEKYSVKIRLIEDIGKERKEYDIEINLARYLMPFGIKYSEANVLTKYPYSSLELSGKVGGTDLPLKPRTHF